jgi:hypothetical protein
MNLEKFNFNKEPKKEEEGNKLDNNKKSGIFEDFDKNNTEKIENTKGQDPDFGLRDPDEIEEYWKDLERRIKEFKK